MRFDTPALTLNRTGWTAETPNELSQQFIAFSASAVLPVLDLGAAFGVAALPALAAGAQVIANDLAANHLDELAKRVPDAHRHRLTLLLGRFPRDLALPAASLAAIHASNVLHFLTGAQMATALRQFARWLAPGGRLFLHAATPYRQPFAEFIPEYERRLAAGDEWPGWVDNLRRISRHRLLGQMPKSMHLLESRLLERWLAGAPFSVEQLGEYRATNLSKTLWLDGRECVAAVAVRH